MPWRDNARVWAERLRPSGLLYSTYETRLLADIDPERLPRHVAVMADGNRRWARLNAPGQDLAAGYRAGADKLREFVQWCDEVGIKVVTLWVLSTDNLTRDADEVAPLLGVIEELAADLVARGRWRVQVVGDLDLLPADVAARLRGGARQGRRPRRRTAVLDLDRIRHRITARVDAPVDDPHRQGGQGHVVRSGEIGCAIGRFVEPDAAAHKVNAIAILQIHHPVASLRDILFQAIKRHDAVVLGRLGMRDRGPLLVEGQHDLTDGGQSDQAQGHPDQQFDQGKASRQVWARRHVFFAINVAVV